MDYLIINADDCGYNSRVNQEIERFIILGKISSTSIMANMDDLDGVKDLYDKYHAKISFGVHINLTEGRPLLVSQELLDYGFLIKDPDKGVVFNGLAFYHKSLPKKIQKAVLAECLAQIEKIRSLGIELSHLDSHHLMHTSPCMFNITPRLLKVSGLKKTRRVRNYMSSSSLSFLPRQLWFSVLKCRVKGVVSTDWHEMFTQFYNLSSNGFYKKGSIELMTHPGGHYPEEDKLMLDTDYSVLFKDYDLISFNQL